MAVLFYDAYTFAQIMRHEIHAVAIPTMYYNVIKLFNMAAFVFALKNS